MSRILVALMLMFGIGGNALAAPGDSAPRTPRAGSDELAEKHYKDGLRHRDAAWVYEGKLAGLTGEKERAAYAQFIQRTYLRALEAFQKAVVRDPKMYQAFSSLGYAQRKTGNMDAALDAYGRALSLNPTYAEAIEYRAEAYIELGRVEEAKQAFEMLSALKPAYAVRLLDFAEQWATGQPESEARADLLLWAAQKRDALGAVKEAVEKW